MSKTETNRVPGSYRIEALWRGMSVIEIFLQSRRPMRLDEIAEATSLPKTTIFRILCNFVERGWLVTSAKGYWLGLAFLELGTAVEQQLEIRAEAIPELTMLRDELRETVHLGVLDATHQVVYLEKLESSQAIGVMMSRVGLTAPAHCTGVGKALLAYLDADRLDAYLRDTPLARYTDTTIVDTDVLQRELTETRARGFAIDEGEHELHVRCIAAPIRDRSGAVVAAISIAGPDSRMPENLVASELPPRLMAAAAAISRRLGSTATTKNESGA